MHSVHNAVDKNSIGHSIEQCQHPGEGAHIQKSLTTKNEKPADKNNEIRRHNNKNCWKTLHRQYSATIQTAISGGKHNYPYQIGKIEVAQHQPQYDNRTHS